MKLTEIWKAIFLGLVEGVTEWLPISSTGHMLLVDAFLQLQASEAWKELFFVVIQLGAILAVVVLFWRRLLPIEVGDRRKLVWNRSVVQLWLKILVACIPGAVATLLLDSWVDAHLRTPVVIALALMFYGVVFLAVEQRNRGRRPAIRRVSELTYGTAWKIGLFQVLAIIPGTSRSGATIIGALLLGVSRVAAAEFTFFLAIPVMAGMSLLKILKLGLAFTGTEYAVLLAGMAAAFLVSLVVIRALLHYVKHRDFSAFGIYRIVLGSVVLLWFLLGT